jgi:hypothetical protein
MRNAKFPVWIDVRSLDKSLITRSTLLIRAKTKLAREHVFAQFFYYLGIQVAPLRLDIAVTLINDRERDNCRPFHWTRAPESSKVACAESNC